MTAPASTRSPWHPVHTGITAAYLCYMNSGHAAVSQPGNCSLPCSSAASCKITVLPGGGTLPAPHQALPAVIKVLPPLPGPPHSAPGSLTWWSSSCGDSLRGQHAGSISHPAGLLLPLGVGVNGCRELGTQRNHLPGWDLLLPWLCQMEWRKQGRRRALAALLGCPGPPGAEAALRHSCL